MTTKTTTQKPAIGSKAVKVIERVIEAIDAEPKTLFMNNWHTGEYVPARPDASSSDTHFCATTHCVAGFIVVQAKCKPIDADLVRVPAQLQKRLGVRALEPTELIAEKILRAAGVADSHPLFTVLVWPKKFTERYRNAKGPRARATVAIARLRHFIATGE